MTSPKKNDPRTNGRWTHEQHDKFILGLKLYGKNWKKIEDLIGTRNGAQIRSHAQKFFIKIQKQIDYEEPEEVHESIPENQTSLTNFSKTSAENEEQEYSYFMNRIMRSTNPDNCEFDFWESLVDHKMALQHENSAQIPFLSFRKNSFTAVSELDNGEQLDKGPTKKIKL